MSGQLVVIVSGQPVTLASGQPVTLASGQECTRTIVAIKCSINCYSLNGTTKSKY